MNTKALNLLLFGDNKCIHYCHGSKPHIMAVHTLNDDEECDRIEKDRVCRECNWASTGIDHVRGTIR